MKQQLQTLFESALDALKEKQSIAPDTHVKIQLDRSKNPQFGDFACNLAMLLAKAAKRKPRDLAQEIVAALPASPLVEKAEIAGPGFINLFLTPQAYYQVIDDILAQKENYGRSEPKYQSVLLEFVSANPTGPLHVGHGRGAAYGAALGDLLDAAGYDVHREYYVNDGGRQMDTLAVSVWVRYLELCGEEIPFPTDAYKGDYIWDIAADVHRKEGEAYHYPVARVLEDLPPDENAGGDKTAYMAAFIVRAKALLNGGYREIADVALNVILGNILKDLEEFGVFYQKWFSERSLMDENLVDHGIKRLQAGGHVYRKDGALWFRSTDFGDEKDRVLIRENGQSTYFASDVAYHVNKLERGFDKLINIWGADHHGYVPRIKAAIQALEGNADRLSVLLVQFATLYRGEERLQMSTRSGEFVTLRELRSEVGNDAARFFYILRKTEQHLEFDLELAKSHSNDNPVYYIQYAHARVAAVMDGLARKGWQWQHDSAALSKLDTEHEKALLAFVSRYPEVIEAAAGAYEPHQLAYYLRDLANAFHTYYNAHKFLVDDEVLRNARLSLIIGVRQVLRNGLAVLGVSAPDKM